MLAERGCDNGEAPAQTADIAFRYSVVTSSFEKRNPGLMAVMRSLEDQSEGDRSADTNLAFNFLKNLAKPSSEDRESGATARNEACPVHKICSFRCTDDDFEGVSPSRAEETSPAKGERSSCESVSLNSEAARKESNENGMSVELRHRVPPPFIMPSGDESAEADRSRKPALEAENQAGEASSGKAADDRPEPEEAAEDELPLPWV